MNEMQIGVWEDFTSALEENNIFEAELLLDSMNSVAGESAWEEVLLKMHDEWALWLTGKSEFNNHKNNVCV